MKNENNKSFNILPETEKTLEKLFDTIFSPSYKRTVGLVILFIITLSIPVTLTLLEKKLETRKEVMAAELPFLHGFGGSPGNWYTPPKGPEWDEQMIQKMTEGCANFAHVGTGWDLIEPNPPINGQHTYNWSLPDAGINSHFSKGMQIMYHVVATPSWANGGHPTNEAHLWPPDQVHRQDYIDFVSALAQRYKGKIKFYEFWNEANGCGWHPGCGGDQTVKADEYSKWLKVIYDTVKSVDPSVMVSTTGLDIGGTGTNMTFINTLYNLVGRDGCNGQPCWDAASIHPYGSPMNFAGIDALRNVMVSHGDSSKPIYITEYGWNTENGRSANLQQVFSTLSSPKYSFVKIIRYLIIADVPQAPDYGLTDENLVNKPSFETYKALGCGGTLPTVPPSGNCSGQSCTTRMPQSCVDCVASKGSGALDWLRTQPGFESCSTNQLVEHWCCGMSAKCDNLTTTVCANECKGSTGSNTRIYINPNPAGTGTTVAMTVTGDYSCSTNISENAGAGLFNCNPSGGMTCNGGHNISGDPNPCWWKWTCTAGNSGVYIASFNASGTNCSSTQTYIIGDAFITPITPSPAPPYSQGSTINFWRFSLSNFAPVNIPSGENALSNVSNTFVSLLVALGMIFAILFIVYAGIKFITAGGDKEKIESAKRTLTYAIVGLLIIVLSFAIIRLIGSIIGARFMV